MKISMKFEAAMQMDMKSTAEESADDEEEEEDPSDETRSSAFRGADLWLAIVERKGDTDLFLDGDTPPPGWAILVTQILKKDMAYGIPCLRFRSRDWDSFRIFGNKLT